MAVSGFLVRYYQDGATTPALQKYDNVHKNGLSAVNTFKLKSLTVRPAPLSIDLADLDALPHEDETSAIGD